MSQNQYRNRKGRKPRSRVTAGILALVFGVFGVHKFYLHRPGQGILFVFLFMMTSRLVFPLSAILGIFDAFRLFSMSDEEFHRKYNRGAWVNPTNRNEPQTRTQRRQTAQRQPTRGASRRANPFKKSGLKKYKDFDLEGAIVDFSKGLEINNQDADLHFNIANAYSLTEQKDKAYHHLAKAVELGYNNYELINTKDDLAFVRIQPEWDDFKENNYRISPTGFSKRQETKEQPPVDDVLLAQLNRLAELRNRGLLSDQEFSLERKKLLSRR